MTKPRTTSLWTLAVPLALAGCAAPMAGGRGAASSQSGDHEFETLIRIDQHGNILEGPSATKPADAEAESGGAATDPQAATRSPSALQAPRGSAVIAAASGERRLPQSAPIASRTRPDAAAPLQEADGPRALRGEPYLPPGVEPTLVRSTRFALEYDDQVLGPDGIARVELYGTLDGGRTWHKLGEDRDRRSPYLVEMPDEGLYGFRIAVAGHNGLASRPPTSGEPPELWVRVDLSEPLFRGNLRTGEAEARLDAPQTVAENHRGDDGPPAPERQIEPQFERQTVAKPPAGEVRQAGHAAPLLPEESGDWQAHLATAIELAQRQLAGDAIHAGTPEQQFAHSLKQMLGAGEDDELPHPVQPAGGASLSEQEKARLDARLRLLYLAAGRRDEAIRSSRHQNAQQNEFWSHQLHGLNLLLEPSDRLPPARRSAAALVELRDAAERLAAASELQVRNLTFCTAAHSFGVYETSVEGGQWKHNDYRQKKFEPDQPVVLYFEVVNFQSQQHTSREFPDGAWRTSLRGSYTIVDPAGRPVERRELKLRDDLCRNRRHDYFVAYKTWIPKLNPGRYTLELLVEDALAEKIGTATIDFEVAR